MYPKLDTGNLICIICKEGRFPFFIKRDFLEGVRSESTSRFTPPEFDQPGKYPVIFLEYCNPKELGFQDYGDKFLKFLSASGIWYLYTIPSIPIENYVEKAHV